MTDPCDLQCGEDFFHKKERCVKHHRTAKQCVASIASRPCDHEWQEQPGEPPVDVCSRCGKERR